MCQRGTMVGAHVSAGYRLVCEDPAEAQYISGPVHRVVELCCVRAEGMGFL